MGAKVVSQTATPARPSSPNKDADNEELHGQFWFGKAATEQPASSAANPFRADLPDLQKEYAAQLEEAQKIVAERRRKAEEAETKATTTVQKATTAEVAPSTQSDDADDSQSDSESEDDAKVKNESVRKIIRARRPKKNELKDPAADPAQ